MIITIKRIGVWTESPHDFTDFLVNIFELSLNLSVMGSITFSILGFTYQLWWNFLSEKENEQMVNEIAKAIKDHFDD